MKPVLLQFAVLSSLLLAGCRSTSNLPAVKHFVIDRYLGTWYEAARFPHRFEKGLVNVTAEYSKNSDGTIKVVNRGFNPQTEEWKQATGVAKFKGDLSIGWLKVSFFKPFYASYKILYLDDDYTHAIVTGPSYNYLWILVRNPAIPEKQLQTLVSTAAGFGFDTNRLVMVDQSTRK